MRGEGRPEEKDIQFQRGHDVSAPTANGMPGGNRAKITERGESSEGKKDLKSERGNEGGGLGARRALADGWKKRMVRSGRKLNW